MGEGKFIGRRYIFIRFKNCPLNCVYCDEHKKDNLCRIEKAPGSGEFIPYHDNNIEYDLEHIVKRLITPDLFAISFTGGEPLLYYDKLKEYSDIIHNLGYKTHLESNGMFPNRIIFFDYASIDIKLQEHFIDMDSEQYLKLYNNELATIKKLYNLGSDVYAKIVIMSNTSPKVVGNIAKELSDIGKDITLCIQPVSPISTIKAPSKQKIFEIMSFCGEFINNIICTPQIHKYMGVL